MNVENEIRDFLINKGVELFWVDSHLTTIRYALSSNSHFASGISNQKVTVKQRHVSTYTARLTLIRPDSGVTERCTLKYTFRPKHKKAHKLYQLDREVIA